MRPAATIVVLFVLLTAGVEAQNLSRLYAREKLAADQARWREQITAEFRDTIAPAIRPEDKARLDGVRLEFPLAAPSGDPFAFYSDPAGRVIHIPALSLRFFSDLLVSTAWLNAHGYEATTVQDYVGVLFRQAEFPRAELPQLFDTLGVPADARDEEAVSARASRNFGKALVFLIAHELGHIAAGHRTAGISDEQWRKDEIEADAFAIDMVRRIPVAPLGLVGSSRVDLQACKLEYSIVSPK